MLDITLTFSSPIITNRIEAKRQGNGNRMDRLSNYRCFCVQFVFMKNYYYRYRIKVSAQGYCILCPRTPTLWLLISVLNRLHLRCHRNGVRKWISIILWSNETVQDHIDNELILDCMLCDCFTLQFSKYGTQRSLVVRRKLQVHKFFYSMI